MSGTTVAIISAACAIGGFILCYLTFFRNTKKDCQEEGKETGSMMSELGYIKANTDEIKRKQEKQDDRHLEIIGRLTDVEASTKSAHKRIDDITGRKDT